MDQQNIRIAIYAFLPDCFHCQWYDVASAQRLASPYARESKTVLNPKPMVLDSKSKNFSTSKLSSLHPVTRDNSRVGAIAINFTYSWGEAATPNDDL